MNGLSVSVIIPTYNRAKEIVRSLRSVLAAVAPGDEIIVVDDGSTDNTREILEPYRDLIHWVDGPHRGPGAARNCGIAAARNPLVAFNDSDDEWWPDKLALQRAFMQARPDVLFCSSDIGHKDQLGTESHHGLLGWHHDPRSWNEILGPARPYSVIATLPAGRKDFNVHVGSFYEPMLRAGYVATQTAVVRREQAGDMFRFGEDIPVYEDYECFVRLARLGQAAYFDCETVWQCDHDGPRLTDANRFDRAGYYIKVLQRTFGSDRDFRSRHEGRYRQTLRAEYSTRARYFIRNGRREEACAELRSAEGAPLGYRFLATLPNGLLLALVDLYQCTKRMATNAQRSIRQ
jgi:glycosyltransferase involved in cell wall biosynthesis